jgi:AcrR family transcriptional regulator
MAINPTYYPGELRRDLLAATVAAIAAQGTAAVSLRSVAKSVGVSHAAPQNHFGDKAGLFAAVAVEGFQTLEQAFRSETTEPWDRLLELGVAYVRHALEHPSHFAVMWDRTLYEDHPSVMEAQEQAFGSLLRALSDSEGEVAPDASLARAERAWAMAHGMAVLLVTKALVPPEGMDTFEYVQHQLGQTDFSATTPAPRTRAHRTPAHPTQPKQTSPRSPSFVELS